MQHKLTDFPASKKNIGSSVITAATIYIFSSIKTKETVFNIRIKSLSQYPHNNRNHRRKEEFVINYFSINF
jgi:hypothetical protein